MPASPLRSSRVFADIEGALAILREGGGRVSRPRRAILEALFGATGPLSAEQVAARAGGGEPLDVASTYRNLEHLERRGLVRHVHLGHGPGLYELAGSGEREYAVCERCSAVIAVEPAVLDRARREIEHAVGYQARFGHFPIVGLCRRCADAVGKSDRVEHRHEH
jgi:Fur family transcriptional regulator, ferric uptake regulator